MTIVLKILSLRRFPDRLLVSTCLLFEAEFSIIQHLMIELCSMKIYYDTYQNTIDPYILYRKRGIKKGIEVF